MPTKTRSPSPVPVEDGDGLLTRAVRHPAVWVYLVGRPALDSVRGEVLEVDRAEVWEDVVAEDRVVVAECGWLALTVLLDVAEVLSARVGDGRAGADRPGQDAGGCLDEGLAEPGFRVRLVK